MNVLGFVLAFFYLFNAVLYVSLAAKSKNATVVRKNVVFALFSLTFLTLLILFGTGPGVLA